MSHILNPQKGSDSSLILDRHSVREDSDKPFREANCSKGQPYWDACVSPGCTKPAITCSVRECECRKQHQNQEDDRICVKADVQKLYKNLIKVQQQSLQSTKDIIKKLEQIQDSIKSFKSTVPELYISANLTEAQRNFRKLVRERKFELLKGDDLAKILSEKVQRKATVSNCSIDQVEVELSMLHEYLKNSLRKISAICNLNFPVGQQKIADKSDQEKQLQVEEKRANQWLIKKKIQDKVLETALKESAQNQRSLDSFKKQSKIQKLNLKKSILQGDRAIQQCQDQGRISKILNSKNKIQKLKDLFKKRKDGQRSQDKKKIQIKKLGLVYRASENKFSVKVFHEKCDDLKDTVVLIKTQNEKVIGGYNPCRWVNDSKEKFISDETNESFVFSYTNGDIFKIQEGNTDAMEKAIGCNPKYGPMFAGDQNCSLKICDRANTKDKSIGHPLLMYKNKNYKQKKDQSHFEKFNGNRSKFFKIQEWQVFQIEFMEDERHDQEAIIPQSGNFSGLRMMEDDSQDQIPRESIRIRIRNLEKEEDRSQITEQIKFKNQCSKEGLSTCKEENHQLEKKQCDQRMEDNEQPESGEIVLNDFTEKQSSSLSVPKLKD